MKWPWGWIKKREPPPSSEILPAQITDLLATHSDFTIVIVVSPDRKILEVKAFQVKEKP